MMRTARLCFGGHQQSVLVGSDVQVGGGGAGLGGYDVGVRGVGIQESVFQLPPEMKNICFHTFEMFRSWLST